jgi:hypothetical protein
MDRDTFLPWEKYSALTTERLAIVADTLRKATDATLELYDPIGGDTPWSHGCRAHVRRMKAVTDAAKEYEWLTILPDEESLRFTFAIGGVPIRSYRGYPEDVPTRHLYQTFAEIFQLQMVLIEGARATDQVLRMAIETDSEGQVSAITLVELDTGGTPLNTYAIPELIAANNVVPAQTKAIELPPLEPEPIQDAETDVQKRTQAKKKNA